MKTVPFNLEKAKAGAKLITRDGSHARILCWDLKQEDYPIIAAVNKGGVESVCFYTNDGGSWVEGVSGEDLFILEEPTIRPYANAEEVFKDMKEHGPMLKLKDHDNYYYHILSLSYNTVEIRDNYYRFDELKATFTWQDGHPCGVEEG